MPGRSVGRGSFFNLQGFVDGCLKRLVDVLSPAYFHFVSSLGELPEQAVRHTQAGCGGGFVIIHGVLLCVNSCFWPSLAAFGYGFRYTDKIS